MFESPETLNTHAIELASHGNYAEAIACLKRAIYIEKSNYLLWYNLGITYRDSGDLQAAKQALLTAYELDPTYEDQEVLEGLSLVCLSLGETGEAFEYCSIGLDMNEYNPRLWNNLGVLHFTEAEYEQACRSFEKALSLSPYYYDALFNLRDTYAELGNKPGEKECARLLNELRQGTFKASV